MLLGGKVHRQRSYVGGFTEPADWNHLNEFGDGGVIRQQTELDSYRR